MHNCNLIGCNVNGCLSIRMDGTAANNWTFRDSGCQHFWIWKKKVVKIRETCLTCKRQWSLKVFVKDSKSLKCVPECNRPSLFQRKCLCVLCSKHWKNIPVEKMQYRISTYSFKQNQNNNSCAVHHKCIYVRCSNIVRPVRGIILSLRFHRRWHNVTVLSSRVVKLRWNAVKLKK